MVLVEFSHVGLFELKLGGDVGDCESPRDCKNVTIGLYKSKKWGTRTGFRRPTVRKLRLCFHFRTIFSYGIAAAASAAASVF